MRTNFEMIRTRARSLTVRTTWVATHVDNTVDLAEIASTCGARCRSFGRIHAWWSNSADGRNLAKSANSRSVSCRAISHSSTLYSTLLPVFTVLVCRRCSFGEKMHLTSTRGSG
jgi:hypothetical protein